MAKLLVYRPRTIHAVKSFRKDLQKSYNPTVKNRLRPLLNNLKQKTTVAAAAAARQIIHLVLDEFKRMNKEEKRIYERQLTLGLEDNDVKSSNTITAQLVHYALYLLKSDNDKLMSLIYSIILVICKLGVHFIFRHELFKSTPEIYTLSLLLISTQQYALTLSGLRLCVTILNGDEIEHKYALAYSQHDTSSVRKILDAIKWLLSPYITLKNLWKKENDGSAKEKNELVLNSAESLCFRHAGILLEQRCLRNLAPLFYGSKENCEQVTKDDIHNFVEIIGILTNSRMTHWNRDEDKSYFCPMLVSHLCALLTPILFYAPPSVNRALRNEDHRLLTIPKVIPFLLEAKKADEAMINTCIRFYTHFVQLKCKEVKVDNDTDDNQENVQLSDVKTTGKLNEPPIFLNLSEDLISSYFDLYRQIREQCLADDKCAQQEQIQRLLGEEWKKLNTVQLQHENEQLKRENMSLKEEQSRLRNELQRTHEEKDRVNKEYIQKAQEVDRLKLMLTTAIHTEPQQPSISLPVDNNNEENSFDDLENLAPHEITPAQAERCIRAIYLRRTRFNDPDMRQSICGSLKHLGSDLYSSPVHFLHELIQNAEDNFYDDNVVPCLHIELNHNYILLSNNERGLRKKDVLAICSVAVSTKTTQQEQIGEKGVGFKSVFAASNEPLLISHAWQFQFRVPGHDAMSYISPLWITNQDIPDCISSQISTSRQETYLYLPLKFQAHPSETESFLNQVIKAVDPCILLNMRRLKNLEIIDKRNDTPIFIKKELRHSIKLVGQSNVTFEDFLFNDLTGSVVELSISSERRTFRVYNCYIDIPNSIEQRKSSRTRLIIAFPCENDYYLTSTVYTGLPVCDLGFNFLFNADFQLVTNRENVRENVPVNEFIRNHLAALFVYLLLNDMELRKDISRYCPSTNTRQLKHSTWWQVMVDDINKLITKYFSVLLGTEKGKEIRYFNTDMAALVSKEQLQNCADIQVIDLDTDFFTAERLKSLHIQSVSIIDILNCFPDREERASINEFRQNFQLESQKKGEQWWSQLFHYISQVMPSDVFKIMLQKPIFLLNNKHQRQHLPKSACEKLCLYISDNPSFRMWKRQLILLQYSSEFEKTALLKSEQVQPLAEEDLIKIIHRHHLQLAASYFDTDAGLQVIEEVWKDLFYLKSRVHKLEKSTPFVVPVNGTSNLTIIQNAILPTVLGVDIRSFMYSTTTPIICLPYYNTDRDQLMDILQWEYFLLEMDCQRPSLHLSSDDSITKLIPLPSFAMFTDEKCALLAVRIMAAHTDHTKDCLRQFPIMDDSKIVQQISRVSDTFDENIVRNLPSLPRIAVPPHCRALAIVLGVRVEYDLHTCVSVLKLLSDEKNTNVDLYTQWLGHLQLYVLQQHDDFDRESLLSSCQIYLPDQQNFFPLNDLLIVPDNKDHPNGNLFISKYLNLQWISPSVNQIYWHLRELFHILGCTCAVTIDHIYETIYRANHDKTNFFALGDCTTTLTENGMEVMIILFQYLDDLIMQCVKQNIKDHDLYRTIVENKHQTAPCGSREDLQWRFSLSGESISTELKKLTGIILQQKKISLPTIDRRLVTKTTENIVYTGLEVTIVQNLAKDIDKRYFISPSITRTCPLVIATFDIDYVERRGKLEWEHTNNNMECQLTQLTDIFRNAVDDFELEVMTAKYARVNLLLSDYFVIDSIDKQDKSKIDEYMVLTEFPFWIFNKTILLCADYEKSITTRATIAISALTTLLYKRKSIPIEEAKVTAQQKISACTEFRSNRTAHVAGAQSSIYSYTDVLFPADHRAIESMTISIGRPCTTEQDLEDDQTITEVVLDRVAENRAANDRVYRSLARTQNHNSRNDNMTKDWIDPFIIDTKKQTEICHNAEHFFFAYLQYLYGSVDVTATKNWRSSSRLATYPNNRRNIDDTVGFDFELHDTRQLFTRTSKSTTKICYFEVKDEPTSNNNTTTTLYVPPHKRDRHQRSRGSNNENNNYTANRASTNRDYSSSISRYSTDDHHWQQRPQRASTNKDHSSSSSHCSTDDQHWQQQQQRSKWSNNRNNNITTQSASANNIKSVSTRQHQQRQGQTFHSNDDNNHRYHQQSHNKKW
ncbi:unnamed protein product [Rotaria sordida]|uniref:Protein NO VEIN C-terminal domain-containing protein n=1 Tax=Rotaria sordida TaxID=392033 RepID=A0A815GD69_9BILA|nr:unnamed protein product [Rotaria sordida]CAF1594808.1 unnamed protein product [Rotaria sordida]